MNGGLNGDDQNSFMNNQNNGTDPTSNSADGGISNNEAGKRLAVLAAVIVFIGVVVSFCMRHVNNTIRRESSQRRTANENRIHPEEVQGILSEESSAEEVNLGESGEVITGANDAGNNLDGSEEVAPSVNDMEVNVGVSPNSAMHPDDTKKLGGDKRDESQSI
jgi:hypothetical protein